MLTTTITTCWGSTRPVLPREPSFLPSPPSSLPVCVHPCQVVKSYGRQLVHDHEEDLSSCFRWFLGLCCGAWFPSGKVANPCHARGGSGWLLPTAVRRSSCFPEARHPPRNPRRLLFLTAALGFSRAAGGRARCPPSWSCTPSTSTEDDKQGKRQPQMSQAKEVYLL